MIAWKNFDFPLLYKELYSQHCLKVLAYCVWSFRACLRAIITHYMGKEPLRPLGLFCSAPDLFHFQILKWEHFPTPEEMDHAQL